MARDIAQDTLNVGNALTSVRIDQMILNLAKGIAWGQYELDKVGVDITKMMGAPGTVSIGGEQISMLEAGFTPSFYHFVDTILEMKMEVNIREESSSSTAVKNTVSGSSSRSSSASFSASGSYNALFFKAKMSASGSVSTKNTSAFSNTVDSKHAQKFSQDLSASSLMRTKLVPIPPPELLLERIKILLEKLREEAEEAEKKSEEAALTNMEENKLFVLEGIDHTKFDDPDREFKKALFEAFLDNGHDLLKTMDITSKGTESAGDVTRKKWILKDKAENKYIAMLTTTTDGENTTEELSVHSGGISQGEAFSFDDLFDLDMG